MIHRYFPLLCIMIFTLPLLSGCWDSLDIEKRATVLALAIDKAEQEEDDMGITYLKDNADIEGKDLIRLTAQIAVPGRIPLGPQTGGGGGESENPVWVLSVVGSSLDAALLNLQQELADPIFLGHLRVIIVSEEIAKEGINRFNDYLRRQPEIRRTSWLAISEEKAANYMKVAPELERVPALYLIRTLENTVRLGKFPKNPIALFWRVHTSKGQDAYLPYLVIKKGSNINLEGLAYFKGNSMKGVIKPIEIGLLMAIINEGKGGYGAFYKIPGTNKRVLLRAMKRDSKIKSTIKNGVPEFFIKVQYQNEVDESDKAKINDPKMIQKLEHIFNEEVKEAFDNLIKKMQEEESDIFGFGEYIRAKHPIYWRENVKTSENWHEIYKDLNIQVEVESQIDRTRMKAK